MSTSKLDPWTSPEELMRVYSQLYSSCPSSQQQGLAHVRMWSSRTRLPLSVECTAELVRASGETGDRAAQVAAYSLAIIRFVNGQVDRAQGGAFARSVAAVAAGIGIPDWMIDIRHDATHKSLPRLEQLRMASRYALGWLEDHYWRPLNTAQLDSEAETRLSLARYSAARNRMSLDRKPNKAEITRVVEGMCNTRESGLVLPRAILQEILHGQHDIAHFAPLLHQLARARPGALPLLACLLCQRYASATQRVAELLGALFADAALVGHCAKVYPLLVELLLKSGARELCLVLLKAAGDSLEGRFATLRDLLSISLKQTKSSAMDTEVSLDTLDDQVTRMKSVLAELQTREQTGEGRFHSCEVADSASVWDHLPFGTLAGDLAPPLDMEECSVGWSDAVSAGKDLADGEVYDIPMMPQSGLESVEFVLDIDTAAKARSISKRFSLEKLRDIRNSIKILGDLD